MARWGMPGPPKFGGAPITNIRNVKSPHWRRWLGKGSRCIVPATSFCEYADTKPRKTPNWFALSEDRPLFAFAGVWTPWRGVRGPEVRAVEGEHRAVRFSDDGGQRDRRARPPKGDAGHSDNAGRGRLWLTAETRARPSTLQRPLPDDALRIVAKGERADSL